MVTNDLHDIGGIVMRSIKRTTVIALMTAMLTGINILGDYSTNIMAGEANPRLFTAMP